MVLDQFTASSGGVCVLIGSSCCTYIPAEDSDGGAITLALTNLTALRDSLSADHAPLSDWFSWLSGTGWQPFLLKLLTPVLIMLVLVCLFTSCVIPCFKSMIAKAVTSTMVSLQLLRETGTHENVEYVPLSTREADG